MKYFVVLSALAICAFGAPKRPTSWQEVLDSKVVGGEDAKPGQFPHQISLQYYFEDKGKFKHICGGSIIAADWIITAGHCVWGGKFQVIAGLTNLDQKEGFQKRYVIKSIVHEKYLGVVGPYDLGLMKVDIPFQFNEAVKPIKLPALGQKFTGFGVISGWGSVSYTTKPNYPNTLQTAVLPIIDNEECRNNFEGVEWGLSGPLHDTNVCGGPTPGRQGACSGDSGGPLIQGDILVGIVSWGVVPCGTPGAPSVFTGVSNFVDYIENVLRGN